jgi:hypothetical protein
MPRGGKRPGAGAPKKLKPQPVGDKNAAARILAAVFGPKPHAADDCKCEKCWWWALMWAADLDLRERTGQKLYDKRDGKAVQTVNHLHDKPLTVDVPGLQSLADAIRAGRMRAAQTKK